MTHGEIQTLLEQSGIPWAYHHWDKPQDLPWGVYVDVETNDFHADDHPYFPKKRIRLEVYSLERDETIDARVEQILRAAHIPYSMDYTYIYDEGMYETIFEIEVTR